MLTYEVSPLAKNPHSDGYHRGVYRAANLYHFDRSHDFQSFPLFNFKRIAPVKAD
jgi:hypothetical protein